ncbi:secretin and TonB N-terminal domain-containing protein [Candidatus Saganbacteria bacterium]|nr:secretin and TonB N-terminal domain-containing protein [Candidatus Saganbacteria bacterium]
MFRKIIVFVLLTFPISGFAYADNLIPKIDFVDASVIDAVQALASQAGFDLVAGGDSTAQKRVSLHLKNVTAEEAIEYVLRTNGLTFEKKGKTILVSTLPQDQSQTGYKKVSRSIELKHLSGEKVTALISKIAPELTTVASERANTVIIRGKDSDVAEAYDVIQKIDKPIPQILIEGQVVEISKNDSIRFGIDHNSGIFKFLNGKNEDIKSTLNCLLADGKANVVASPRIATLDNHEAIINIGSRIPFAVPVSSSSTTTQWTINYIDAGVRLKITPQIGKDNQIVAILEPEVSSISEWRATAAGEFPVISSRNASATLRVKNGETIVVGGLDSETERVNVSRIPIIGQFPILNLFFQNRTVEKTKTEIVFLITPHII